MSNSDSAPAHEAQQLGGSAPQLQERAAGRPASAKLRSRKEWSWKQLLPRLLLLLILTYYLRSWVSENAPMLFDPRFQTDDARTSIFPFHRYGPAQALGEDPIAHEMLDLVPWGIRLLYRALVPYFDLFVSTKLVQALALGILGWAGWLLAKSRRAGLGAAALLIVFVLHDAYAVGRIAGGLPRTFAWPCFALWLAGVLAPCRKARYAAPILAAITYPSAMNMILAAEGLYVLRNLCRLRTWRNWRPQLRITWGRLRRYLAVVAVCGLGVLPSVLGGEERGPVHTLEQAEQEPAFSRSGRLWLLPFTPADVALKNALLDPFRPRGLWPTKPWVTRLRLNDQDLSTFLLGLTVLGFVLNRRYFDGGALAFGLGSVVLYFLSVRLAFRLYSPERYYAYGMRFFAACLLVAGVGRFRFGPPRLSAVRGGAALRETAAALYLLVFLALSGTGSVHRNGMELDSHRDAELYAHLRSLPKSTKVASHVFDGDGIPLYAARATMGGFETLQPWFVKSWARQKKRAEDTLSALYETDRAKVLDYAQRNGVSHFLINKGRYHRGMVLDRSRSFEPLSSSTRELLRKRNLSRLVFASPPPQAVVFENERFLLLSVAELERAWQPTEPLLAPNSAPAGTPAPLPH